MFLNEAVVSATIIMVVTSFGTPSMRIRPTGDWIAIYLGGFLILTLSGILLFYSLYFLTGVVMPWLLILLLSLIGGILAAIEARFS